MHAMGGYKQRAYLNCLECFEENYNKGNRLFEVDLFMTADNRIVAMHDGLENQYGIPSPFTLAQFMGSSYQGTTPLSEDDIARLLKTKPDWFLITDFKTENKKGLLRLCKVLTVAGISCRERVIPQIYHPSEASILQDIPFQRVIFTLYRFGNRKKEVLDFISRESRLWGVTMWADWWDNEYAQMLRRHGKHGFVHTINDPARAEELFKQGVSGIYTDFLPTRKSDIH